MTLSLFELILSAISQTFLISQFSAYNQEVVDGGTKNRIWSFMSVVGLIPFALSPISQLFPTADLSIMTYAVMGFSAGICYVASVAHQNQIYINHDEPDKVEALPFDLHNNELLMKSILFISRYMAQFLLAIYFSSLIGCVFLGAPVYAYLSLAMSGVNWLNKNNYFPHSLKTPFLYFNILVLLSTAFGFSTWLYTGLTVALVGFTIYDFIRCTWFNNDSPTAQFPMSEPNHQVRQTRIDDNDPLANQTLMSRISTHRNHKRTSGVHVTFDHFYESQRITDRILDDAPEVDYADYAVRFNQMVRCPSDTLSKCIQSEMLLLDKFDETSISDHQKAFGLPETSTAVEVQIAFLKREMDYFVGRLKNPSYRDLTHQQITEIHRYARLLLNHIQKLPSNQTHSKDLKDLKDQDRLLLHLAVTTGSHCNRMYLESLTSLANDCHFVMNERLSLQERAILQTQSAREAAFKKYYYNTAGALKTLAPAVYSITWADLDDYHTYEDFVGTFGGYFYLRNPCLNQKVRYIGDVVFDRLNYYLFGYLTKQAREKNLMNERTGKPFSFLFSETYNAAYLIEQAVMPEGKLHKIFVEWCETNYPSCYKDVLYDEYFFLQTGEHVEALAEIMLLNLHILDLDAPYPIEPPMVSPTRLSPRQAISENQWGLLPNTHSITFFTDAPEETPQPVVSTGESPVENRRPNADNDEDAMSTAP